MPRRLLPHYGNVMLDLVRQDPGPSGARAAGPVLRAHRAAPQRPAHVQDAGAVLGHRRDPVHPFSDAGMLAEELPNGRLLEANSLVELRMQPERLTGEIADFLDEVWAPAARPCQSRATQPRAKRRKPRRNAPPRSRPASPQRASRPRLSS